MNSFATLNGDLRQPQKMCDQVCDFVVIASSDNTFTVGDPIDLTPKDIISKVMLEEKSISDLV
jgi:hypothetical protein